MFFCKYMVWSITGPSCQGHCLPAIDNGKVCHCFQHTPLVKHYCYWQLIFTLWALKHMVLTLQILRLLWCRWKWTCCKWKEEMWLELKPLRPDYTSRSQRLLLSVSLCHLAFARLNVENWFAFDSQAAGAEACCTFNTKSLNSSTLKDIIEILLWPGSRFNDSRSSFTSQSCGG